MRDHVSVVRSAASLEAALGVFRNLASHPALADGSLDARVTADALLLATEIAASALAREESRGGHYRNDNPDRVPALDHKHQIVTRTDGASLRTFGTLAEAWNAAADSAVR